MLSLLTLLWWRASGEGVARGKSTSLIGCFVHVNHLSVFFFQQTLKCPSVWDPALPCETLVPVWDPPLGELHGPACGRRGCCCLRGLFSTRLGATLQLGIFFWLHEGQTNKMTNFNKGPAYGLSAEVRSKVSDFSPFCLRGKPGALLTRF